MLRQMRNNFCSRLERGQQALIILLWNSLAPFPSSLNAFYVVYIVCVLRRRKIPVTVSFFDFFLNDLYPWEIAELKKKLYSNISTNHTKKMCWCFLQTRCISCNIEDCPRKICSNITWDVSTLKIAAKPFFPLYPRKCVLYCTERHWRRQC